MDGNLEKMFLDTPHNIHPPPQKKDQLKKKKVVIRKQRWNRNKFGCWTNDLIHPMDDTWLKP
jgi:hypothetical protein